MNIINKTFLKLALLPAGVYKKMGVNIPQLTSILNIKLTMDDRRPNTFQQTQRRKKSKPVSTATLGTMIMSVILGLFYLFAFSIGSNMATNLTFYFSMFFFMLSATLISDFTSVLIDVRDSFIILPKPVSDRTFLVARLLHIFIHICKIVVPMSLPGIVYMAINLGVAATIWFGLMVLFNTFFAIFFINALYIVILKITTPQKFQSIISYVQIVFAVLIYASYQIFPRMIDRYHLETLDLASKKGIIFYPIYWFASTWNMLYTHHGTATEWIAAVLGFILPVLSLFIVVKYLATSFNNKLAMISGSGSADVQKPAAVTFNKKRSSYATLLARIFTGSHAEKMGFLFTWKMTARSRDFKLKVYPSIGYLAVYVVIMFMNSKHVNIEQIRAGGMQGKVLVISALYFTSFILTMAINQMIYSEKYKASWIYYISPLQKPGEVILGGAKAAIFKFYIPLVCFITVAGLFLLGPKVLPNVILGLFNELLIATIMVYAGNKMLPFSLHQNNNVKAGSFLRNMSILLVSGLIAVGHFFIYDVMSVVIICSFLSIGATWIMMGSIKNTSWAAVKSSYTED
ncbi:MAG: hypothetical protein ACTHOF_03410 [Flavisolibacter sp.]